MPKKAAVLAAALAVAAMSIAFDSGRAQSGATSIPAPVAPGAPRAAAPRTAAKTAAASADSAERMRTLRAAAEALGMLRYSDIGSATVHLPAVDVVNTMEIWGSGTTYASSATSPEAGYHVTLAYNPAAMRVELARTGSGGAAGADVIEVVSGNYAWNESEIGAGLVPGKGTATPAMAAAKVRLLRLWILPYGVVKAALAAGDKTSVATENGATVITVPLSGPLAGVTVKATLDARNEVATVETRSADPELGGIVAEYSDYADHGEILTDIKSPGHIVEKRAGQLALDVRVTKVDANNPYLVFPVPGGVKTAR